jgi:tetratricopeptide (TPR) repeat protein
MKTLLSSTFRLIGACLTAAAGLAAAEGEPTLYLVKGSAFVAGQEVKQGELLQPGWVLEAKLGTSNIIGLRVDGVTTEILTNCGVFWVPVPSRYRVAWAKNDVKLKRRGYGGGITNTFLYPGDILETGPNSQATLSFNNEQFPLNERAQMQIPFTVANGIVAQFKAGLARIFKHDSGDLRFQIGNSFAGIVNTDVLVDAKPNQPSIISALHGDVLVYTNTNPFQGVLVKRGWRATVDGTNILRLEDLSLDLTNREIISWSLHYLATLDPERLGLGEQFADSVAAYTRGNLVAAFNAYPTNHIPIDAVERAFRATLYLGVGQFDRAAQLLTNAPTQKSSTISAVKLMIAAVQNGAEETTGETSSELLARSYFEQSRSRLPQAREAALRAVQSSPRFGFAWSQLAEMEFSFGRLPETLAALEQAIQYSPDYAPNRALNGFVRAAENDIDSAFSEFEAALQLDRSLASAWLGRGMCLIRQGYLAAGRHDLSIAASGEPLKPIYLSYLAKAHSDLGDDDRAEKELELAMELDPTDPTAPLYRALVRDRQNRPNLAVRDLEDSLSKIPSRDRFRSTYLLDQDRAVRGTRLARIYSDSGLAARSVSVAANALAEDYLNSSAHHFLSQSYSQLQSPGRLEPRFEPAIFGEYFIGNLLAPVGAGHLSETLSQQEYSKLFERDGFGVFSETQYRSSGDWIQSGSQYGRFGDFEYALDAVYLKLRGEGPNNDIEQRLLSIKVKQQIGAADSILALVSASESSGGDSRQRYDPNIGLPGRFRDRQEPNMIIGYNHQWQPGSHALLAFSRLTDEFNARETVVTIPFILRDSAGQLQTNEPAKFMDFFSGNVRSDFTTTAIEAQQLWRNDSERRASLLAGVYYQEGTAASDPDIVLFPTSPNSFLYFPLDAHYTNRGAGDLSRGSAYAYFSIDPVLNLHLTVGLAFDFLTAPANVDLPPFAGDLDIDRSLLSPKAGAIWRIADSSTIRAAFTRSLGSQYFENSVRLEPAQVAGFAQRFRNLAPSSIAGSYPGSEMQTISVALDQMLAESTFLSVLAEQLESEGFRERGVFDYIDVFPHRAMPAAARQEHRYKQRSVAVALNQLLSDGLALGITYSLGHVQLTEDFPDLQQSLVPASHSEWSSVQHDVTAFAQWLHRSGFFAYTQALWIDQLNDGPTNIADDEVLHVDAGVGYRFLRGRGRVMIGVLNLTDRDYRLWPLNRYPDLPRHRTLVSSFTLSF